MERYHRELGIPEVHLKRLEELNAKFNSGKRFGRTSHAFERLNQRFDYLSILDYLANKVEFKAEDIFEVYVDNEAVQKVCYRLDYENGQDLILVLTKDKAIVTLYINVKGDNHSTLRKELYNTIGG